MTLGSCFVGWPVLMTNNTNGLYIHIGVMYFVITFSIPINQWSSMCDITDEHGCINCKFNRTNLRFLIIKLTWLCMQKCHLIKVITHKFSSNDAFNHHRALIHSPETFIYWHKSSLSLFWPPAWSGITDSKNKMWRHHPPLQYYTQGIIYCEGLNILQNV